MTAVMLIHLLEHLEEQMRSIHSSRGHSAHSLRSSLFYHEIHQVSRICCGQHPVVWLN